MHKITFEQLTQQELELYKTKNKDYTGNQGDPFGNFKRRASILALYPNLNLANPQVIAMVDIMKQLDAALWMMSEEYEGEMETIDTRLADVSVYAKIARLLGGKIK